MRKAFLFILLIVAGITSMQGQIDITRDQVLEKNLLILSQSTLTLKPGFWTDSNYFAGICDPTEVDSIISSIAPADTSLDFMGIFTVSVKSATIIEQYEWEQSIDSINFTTIPSSNSNVYTDTAKEEIYIRCKILVDNVWYVSDAGHIAFNDTCGVILQDLLALEALYDSLDGANWTTNTNWRSTADVSTWYGVTVNNSRVTEIDLSNNQLSGNIPSAIGDLNGLTELNLSNNSLTGTIPVEISDLFRLQDLSLYENSLTGSIPSQLGNLNNLKTFSVYSNELTGEIPEGFPSIPGLEYLLINDNQLSGGIAANTGNYSSLKGLDIRDNMFEFLSSEFANISSLTLIKLDGNNLTFEDILPIIQSGFSGTFTYSPQNKISDHDTIFVFPGSNHVVDLDIDDGISPANVYVWYKGDELYKETNSNNFTIEDFSISDTGMYSCTVSNPSVTGLSLYDTVTLYLSEEVASSDSLALIALYKSTDGDNWTNSWDTTLSMSTWYGVTIEDQRVTSLSLPNNNLTGTLPDLSALDALELLILYTNNLSGTIPITIGGLTDLEKLWLSNNSFTGSIPACFGQMDSLTHLYLESNDLSGTIPDEITNSTSLQLIRMFNNDLTGSIPEQIGNITSLTYLQLSDNELSGSIPVSINNLTSLVHLILSSNNLTGELPNLSKLDSLEQLVLYSNNLSGSIPVTIGGLTNLEKIWLSHNELSGEIPEDIGFLSNLTHLYLEDNQLTGGVPVTFTELSNLVLLSLAGNELTDWNSETTIIDSLTSLTQLNIENNNLSFEDILPVVKSEYSGTYTYSPQDTVGTEETLDLLPGDEFTIVLGIDKHIADSNQYIWFKDGTEIDTTSVDTFYLSSVSAGDAGVYTCVVTNDSVPNLTLYSYPVTLNSSIIKGVIEKDYNALIALYEATDGDNWTNSWDTTQNVGLWYGVDTLNSRVTALDLHTNNLVDSLPDEIGELIELDTLNLYDNNLTGSIPETIGDLTKLVYLSLYNNDLSGAIPSSIGNLSQLTILELYNNNLDGNIPGTIYNLTNLEKLVLHTNELTGTVSDSIGNLTNLEMLYLSYNQLSDTIPSSIGNLSELKILCLNNNNLQGEIPASIGELSALNQLYLNDNDLSDEIPSELGDLTNLLIFSIHNNNILGEIPESFINLTSLTQLNIYNNEISGGFTTAIIDSMKNLSVFYAQDNKLTFEDLIPILQSAYSATLDISPQDTIGTEITDTIQVGQDYTIYLGIDEYIVPANQYVWYRADTAFDTTSVNRYTIYDITPDDVTTYYCKVTNDSVPNITLVSYDVTLTLDMINGVASSDYRALMKLYYYTNGPNWTNTWDTTALVSTWYGVTVNENRVTGVELSNNALVDSIPAGIFAMHMLDTLDLSNNQLDTLMGISYSYNTSLLYLDLHGNNISGSIPTNITYLTKLQTLDLSNNDFGGSIPVNIGNNNKLITLDLSSNSLSGELPDGICNMGYLKHLLLDSNMLSGNLPPNLYMLYSIETFNLRANNFTSGLIRDIDYMLHKFVSNEIDSLNINNNKITFSSILPLAGYGFTYSSYKKVGEADTVYILSGDYTIELNIDPEIDYSTNPELDSNRYVWYRNDTIIDTTYVSSLEITDINMADTGYYYARITNDSVPGIELVTESIVLSMNITHGVAEPDYLALLDLYEYTDGDNWVTNTNWLSEYNVSQWYGVTVQNLRVATISLSNDSLKGILPSSISNLDNLTYLDLSENLLAGSIPYSMGELDKLSTLNLSDNLFVGTVFDEISDFASLTNLNLSNNNLTGEFPTFVNDTSLEIVVLSNNEFEGDLKSSFINSPELEKVLLANNNLEDSIPELFRYCEDLEELDLSGNNFTGNIPEKIDTLGTLEILNLSNNNLTGHIPAFCPQGSMIEELYLGNNNLDSNIYIFDKLDSLRILDLGNNNLSDTIQADFWYLKNLEQAWLDSNNFSGTLPDTFGIDSIKELYINSNMLSGIIPVALDTQCVVLDTINYADNKFRFDDMLLFYQSYTEAQYYVPQKDIYTGDSSVYLLPSQTHTIDLEMSAASNTYAWYHIVDGDTTAISGNNQSTLTIKNSSQADRGSYFCVITNSIITDLTLYSIPVVIDGPEPTIQTSSSLCTNTMIRFNVLYPPADAVSYYWQFGDSATSTQDTIQHVYDTAGIYTVDLKIMIDSGNDSIELSTDVNVLLTPDLEFAFYDTVATETKVTIKPNKDADLDSYTGSTNYGSSQYFGASIYEVYGMEESNGLMEFNFDSIPDDAVITSAKLTLYGSNVDHNPNSIGQVSLLKLSSSWLENVVTWNSRPMTTGAEIVYGKVDFTTENMLVDITEFVQYWIDDPNNNYGMSINVYQSSNIGDRYIFASSDHSDTTLHPVLEVTYVSKKEICANDTIDIEVSGAESYIWSSDESITCPTCTTQSFILSDQTEFTITASALNGCPVTEHLSVKTLALPTVNAGDDVSITSEQSTQLSGTNPSSGTIEWSPATGLSATDIYNPNAGPDITTVYTQSITDTNGCVGSDDVVVKVTDLDVENYFRLHQSRNHTHITVTGDDLKIVFLEKYSVPSSQMTYYINNLQGSQISTSTLTANYGYNQLTIDVSGLSDGYYIFIIENSKGDMQYIKFQKK